jgi:hypothetical protein
MRQKPARAQLVVSLTRVPKTWFLKIVREQKKHEITTLVSEVLTPHESAENPVSFPERESITLVHELWQCVRAEVKPRLEALIETLSKRTFETYEEKAEVAARLNELLDEWKFRAISPSSGRVAYFQCRVGKKTANGYFFFQDINAQSKPVALGNPDGPKAPGQIPIFKLADAPPDSRRRPPDLQPVPRKKRNT